jgi:hypothetical protein
MRVLIVLATLLGLVAEAANAREDEALWLTSTVLPGCRLAVNWRPETAPDQYSADQWVNAGVCVGVVGAAFYNSNTAGPDNKFCPPTGASITEAIRLIVDEVDKVPSHPFLREDFRGVVQALLHVRWPCSK